MANNSLAWFAADSARPALLPAHDRVVNVGRVSPLDSEALLYGRHARRLGGAALDVLEEEPLPPEPLLWDGPDVVVSPHAARWWPIGAHALVVANIRALLAGAPL